MINARVLFPWFLQVFLLHLAMVGPAGAAEESHVVAVHPKFGDVSRTITVPGSSRAFLDTTLFAKVPGYLEEITVDVGDRVEKGSVIARLYVPELDAEIPLLVAQVQAAAAVVESRAAEFKAAEARVMEPERALLMYLEAKEKARAAVAQKDVDLAESRLLAARAEVIAAAASVEQARADLSVAEADLDRGKIMVGLATITAPFSGVVTDRYVDPGALVQAANTSEVSPIVKIAQVSILRVGIDVPEQVSRFVHPGTRARIVFDSRPGQKWEEKVSRCSGALNPITRTLPCQIDLKNDQGELRPGSFGRVTLDLETHHDVLSVPSSAVYYLKSKHYVLRVVDGKAVKTRIEMGADDGVSAEVLSGLDPEDLVIKLGIMSARDGEAVTTSLEGAGQ